MTEPEDKKSAPTLSTSGAFRFVLTLGVVNLFADMTYEGASSINGPFLGMLGAGAQRIATDALRYFRGKHVRLFPHLDSTGWKAAARKCRRRTDSFASTCC